MKKKHNNNFLNKNPLITFIIFTVAMIILFKGIFNTGDADLSSFNVNSKTQSVSYFDFKQLRNDRYFPFSAFGFV